MVRCSGSLLVIIYTSESTLLLRLPVKAGEDGRGDSEMPRRVWVHAEKSGTGYMEVYDD